MAEYQQGLEGRQEPLSVKRKTGEKSPVLFILNQNNEKRNDVSGAEIGITKKCNSFHGDILSNVVVLVSIIRMVS